MELLLAHPLDFLPLVLDEAHIVVVYVPSALHQRAQISDILPHNSCHLLQLGQLVAIVDLEHALRADQLLAHSTVVLNQLFRVLAAVDLADWRDSCVDRAHRVKHFSCTSMGLHGQVILRSVCLTFSPRENGVSMRSSSRSGKPVADMVLDHRMGSLRSLDVSSIRHVSVSDV